MFLTNALLFRQNDLASRACPAPLLQISHINLQRGINEAYAPQRAYLASSLQYPWNPFWVWSRCEGRVYHFPLKVCRDGCRGFCNSLKLSSRFPSMTFSLQREKEICTLDKSKLVQRRDHHRCLYFAFYLHVFCKWNFTANSPPTILKFYCVSHRTDDSSWVLGQLKTSTHVTSPKIL